MWSVRVSMLVIASVYACAGCAHRNESPTVAMVRANCESRGVGTRDEIEKTCDAAAAQAAAGERQEAQEREDRQRRERDRQAEESYAQNAAGGENERREADEPAIKPADEPWPVEEQPSAEKGAQDSQVAIDQGSAATAAATKPAADEARKQAEYGIIDENASPACITVESIDVVNGMMARQRRIEQESGVADLSAKRKLGGMLVVLKGQLAAQQAAFKRDTGRAFDRKRDCGAQPVVNESNRDASATKSNEPDERLRARNSACTTFELIEIYKGQMKRQRAIERESGVEDLDAKRRIGEALVLAKNTQAKALADFKRLWKRSFKRAADCATPP